MRSTRHQLRISRQRDFRSCRIASGSLPGHALLQFVDFTLLSFLAFISFESIGEFLVVGTTSGQLHFPTLRNWS